MLTGTCFVNMHPMVKRESLDTEAKQSKHEGMDWMVASSTKSSIALGVPFIRTYGQILSSFLFKSNTKHEYIHEAVLANLCRGFFCKRSRLAWSFTQFPTPGLRLPLQCSEVKTWRTGRPQLLGNRSGAWWLDFPVFNVLALYAGPQ